MSLQINTSKYNQTPIKLVFCDGTQYTFTLASQKVFWDTMWRSKKTIKIRNSATIPMSYYQIPFVINTSYLGGTVQDPNSLRFIIPYQDYTIFDFGFDRYSQNPESYGKYPLSSTLGLTSAVGADDPTLTQGIVLSALSFNGASVVRVQDSPVLDNTQQLTLSAWFKATTLDGNARAIISKRVNSDVQHSYSVFLYTGNKMFIDIDGTGNRFSSNTVFQTGKWYHVAVVYDGDKPLAQRVQFYVNGVLDITAPETSTSIPNYASNLTIGTMNQGYATGFIGSIDEVKAYDLALSQSEITQLYTNSLRYDELDYYTWETMQSKAQVYAKIPFLRPGYNVSVQVYYNSTNVLASKSNIETTFAYPYPKIIGYSLADRDDTTNGLMFMSLYNNNQIIFSNFVLNLSKQGMSSLTAAQVPSNGLAVRSKYLVNVEGNGNSGKMIVPLSWASKEFYYRGFAGTDRFCMLSPWSNSLVSVYDGATFRANYNLVAGVAQCQNPVITTANTMRMNGTQPFLVTSFGTTPNYASVLYPSNNEPKYGVASAAAYVGIGPTAGTLYWNRTSPLTGSSALAAFANFAVTALGNTGNAPAYVFYGPQQFGALQQNDGDGTENTVFVPKRDMSMMFGAGRPMQYIAFASPYNNANCSLYNAAGTFVASQVAGTGTTGNIFRYGFNIGTNALYQAAGWYVQCQKPVWGYYEENANNDENNMFGHLQMRQYVFPEPVITYGN